MKILSLDRLIVATLAVVVSLPLFTARPAAAEENGTITVLHSYARDYTTIEHAGGKVTGGTLTGTGTVLQSSGAPFVEGANSNADCIIYVRMSEDGIDLMAPCTTIDADGDRMFMLSRRESGDIQDGGGGLGRAEIIGGTGKYAGISGSCSYDTEYLPDNRIVTSARCDWKK
ncbi:MAG: hypothetical protein OXU26_00930 [Acidobacteriota bacterium]|nr:hypothetical protein [Acidobacteriota bacterium]MXY66048.1 hypothetical protein [Gammaproteobacteria bacterium]MYG65647.1 hypothetical protein [Gammaproteobacteria bacterium]MYH90168.1 hypothetical protein [Gammaproteobacteria bacterium]